MQLANVSPETKDSEFQAQRIIKRKVYKKRINNSLGPSNIFGGVLLNKANFKDSNPVGICLFVDLKIGLCLYEQVAGCKLKPRAFEMGFHGN